MVGPRVNHCWPVIFLKPSVLSFLNQTEYRLDSYANVAREATLSTVFLVADTVHTHTHTHTHTEGDREKLGKKEVRCEISWRSLAALEKGLGG